MRAFLIYWNLNNHAEIRCLKIIFKQLIVWRSELGDWLRHPGCKVSFFLFLEESIVKQIPKKYKYLLSMASFSGRHCSKFLRFYQVVL